MARNGPRVTFFDSKKMAPGGVGTKLNPFGKTHEVVQCPFNPAFRAGNAERRLVGWTACYPAYSDEPSGEPVDSYSSPLRLLVTHWVRMCAERSGEGRYLLLVLCRVFRVSAR